MENKVVLITGGSSGIGESAALLFAQKGADVAITYKTNKAGAENVVRQIKDLGRKAVAIQGDLSDDDQAKRVVTETVKEFGKIDVLVNNAGRYVNDDEWDGPADVWLKSIQQNLISMMSVSKYVAEIFQKQRSGIMVNISSRHGISGMPDALAYAAAKAGVINVTQAYAKLLAPFGRVNAVSPSATDAGYWHTASKEELEAVLASRPNHKLIDPKTVAEKIVFLASDEAKDITGQNFPVTE
jgi:3-oxoacyl-[acyl-carrier protein] reductase